MRKLVCLALILCAAGCTKTIHDARAPQSSPTMLAQR